MKLPFASLALLVGATTMVSAQVPALISTVVPTQVNYTDPYDGASLMGYLATPASTPKGHIVIIPDWDGVNEYEIERAVMLAAQWGYVGFAADVFGIENYNPPMEEREPLTEKYRQNVTLSNSRINTAIDLVKGLDGDGVVVMGYCFGGTIALNHAMSGEDDAIATIAYHGSINSVMKDLNKTVSSEILIFSGSKDFGDDTEGIVAMEEALNTGGNTWEISRYSNVYHSFTDFTLEVGFPGMAEYSEHVDMRTWESTGRFLQEVFSGEELVADLPDDSAPTWADEQISYTDSDGYALNGMASVPTVIASDENGNEEKLPAVVIVHDANGIDSMEETRAHMLTQLGYVGFAADIYGSDHGYDLSNRTEMFTLLRSIRSDVPLFVKRIRAAVDAAKAHPRVAADKIAAIGYCFGGTGVINYAVTGQDDVRAIVSYHGGLSGVLMDGYQGSVPTIHAKMNIQSGGDDDASSGIEMLENAMEAGNATWEYARYNNVLHSFTNWNDTRGRYNARADVRSWESLKGFLAEAFEDDAKEELVVPGGEPVSEPTETVSEPTEPVSEPTEPVSEPKEPVSEPKEPVSEPVSDPVSEPTEPVSEPKEPVSEPVSEPASKPVSEPVMEPTDPATEPTEGPAAGEVATQSSAMEKTLSVGSLVLASVAYLSL